MQNISNSHDTLTGGMMANASTGDVTRSSGVFTAVCRDIDGKQLWQAQFHNLLTTGGKNLLLDTTLSGSAYTTVGPYMGLISSTSYSTVAVGDTMASHAGWLEAGTTNAPTFSSSGARIICAWSGSTGTTTSTKALSAGLTFTFTGTGTVQGAFIVTGTGAVVTNLSTAGTLYSAGTLTTAQPVISTNTLTLSYSSSLS